MNQETAPKHGRPRQYGLQPVLGFAHPDVALSIAALDELSARLFDLIIDLPQDALDFVPTGTTNSMGMLALHMINTEMGWVQRVMQTTISNELKERLTLGQQAASGKLPPSSTDLATLQDLCQQVRADVTGPALAPVTDIDTDIITPQRTMTTRGVLMHLIWHWTYHTGQVGLLRRLWGAHYQWTFGELGTTM